MSRMRARPPNQNKAPTSARCLQCGEVLCPSRNLGQKRLLGAVQLRIVITSWLAKHRMSSTGSARCSAVGCFLVDLLPLICPACRQPFCSTHFPAPASHDCIAAGRVLSSPAGSGVKWIAQERCAVDQCAKIALESAGRTANSEQDGVVIGKQIRCDGCGRAFCAE